jgi:hypothetical protein
MKVTTILAAILPFYMVDASAIPGNSPHYDTTPSQLLDTLKSQLEGGQQPYLPKPERMLIYSQATWISSTSGSMAFTAVASSTSAATSPA